MNVLFVEDDDATIESVQICFQLFFPEAKLVSVRYGSEALEALAKDDFAVALIDMGLPDMDGLDLIEKAREISSVPILVVSARNGQDIMVNAERLGITDYIAKPFNSKDMIERVRKAADG